MPVKTVEQQALQAVHRVRTQWQTARVARINATRGLLREHGHAIPVGARTVLRRVTAILEDAHAELPGMLRDTLSLTRLQQWAITTATHRGRNKATIALANKLARIVWAVWSRDEEFQARPPLTAVA